MNTPPAMYPHSQSRKTPIGAKPRTPLQERTQSQTNEGSGRLGREAKGKQNEMNMFSTTPFPTKPQHVLLPSTLRKQRSFRDVENDLSGFFTRTQPGNGQKLPAAVQQDPGSEEARGRKAPVLQLKRSVTTLRDMYEAQAERSRPSTAASSAQRPGTASSRLRSASSSEGLAGRNAWEQLNQISADDMALLPALSRNSIERLASESSFASRLVPNQFLASSPNYYTYSSSSPRIAVFKDEPVLAPHDFNPSSSSGVMATSSSSPNFVRLGRSSSVVETLDTEELSSSPNFVKLGTSSPGLRQSSSPTPSMASNGSKKRKRPGVDAGPSFAARTRPIGSSPPYTTGGASASEPSLKSPESGLPSSPPEPDSAQSQSIGNSSPVYRMPVPAQAVSEGSPSSSTHLSLQAALSSSPMPPIQYPVIRAPLATASVLHVPKRIIRNASAESATQWASRLSPVPSEWDEGLPRPDSKTSNGLSDVGDGSQRSNSLSPEPTGNESQIRIITIPDDDHEHEATDELRALPRRAPIAFRSPPLVPTRTNSLFGTQSISSGSLSQSRLDSLRTSVDTRLNSMRSYAHSRQNSFRSGSLRPSSSGSQAASVVVPTWARRYYSGLYRDSFQYLYPSQSNSATQVPISLNSHFNLTNDMTPNINPDRFSSATSRNSRSWQSIRDSLRSSMMEFVPSVLLPRGRPRLGARKSHLTMGIGPLVSNPVSSGALQSGTDLTGEHPTIRHVSEQLLPVDPRAHWAGITDDEHNIIGSQGSTPYHSSQQVNRYSAESESIYYDATSGQIVSRSRFIDVPHLHHDRRLNTGSSKSRGFGFPFNQKARFQAPSVYDSATRPSWFHMDLRDAQVTCFIVGFLCPFAWFIGAFLPLPHRPDSFEDIEKAAFEQQAEGRPEWNDLDIVARLRLERHIKGVEELKWQNARWWKRMNRWMCCVGLVVVILAIVLAVIGTTNHW